MLFSLSLLVLGTNISMAKRKVLAPPTLILPAVLWGIQTSWAVSGKSARAPHRDGFDLLRDLVVSFKKHHKYFIEHSVVVVLAASWVAWKMLAVTD